MTAVRAFVHFLCPRCSVKLVKIRRQCANFIMTASLIWSQCAKYRVPRNIERCAQNTRWVFLCGYTTCPFLIHSIFTQSMSCTLASMRLDESNNHLYIINDLKCNGERFSVVSLNMLLHHMHQIWAHNSEMHSNKNTKAHILCVCAVHLHWKNEYCTRNCAALANRQLNRLVQFRAFLWLQQALILSLRSHEHENCIGTRIRSRFSLAYW